jgi:peptidoglycan/LPS O-acetylase OafA/YrhL
MEEKRTGLSIVAWIGGFLLGILLPAVASFFVALLWYKKPGDHLFNSRAGFFACLLCSALLTGLGIKGWRSSAFLRGLSVGAGLWLPALPFLAGDCLK